MHRHGSGDGHDRGREGGFWPRWRANFLTGLVLVAPIYLTYWIITSAVDLIDRKVGALLPDAWNPHTYLPLPGYGLLAFVLLTALVGALAKNFIAARVIRWTEDLLDRLPIVRSIYNGIKQIAETVLVQSKNSFERACLVEYPRRGLWVVAFIASRTTGEVSQRLGGEDTVTVFMPTTPNPTTGFLFFVRREDVIELDMSVEDAAKLIISAGLVMPPTAEERAAGRAAAARPAAPPPRAAVTVD